MRGIAVAGMMLVLAACVDGPEDLETSEQELIGYGGATIAATVSLGFIEQSTMCTGTVLSEHWILTASHCLTGWTNGSRVDVRAADVAGNANIGLYLGTYETFRHPDASVPGAYDIGLIYLHGNGITGFGRRGHLFSDTRHPWYGDYAMNGWVEGFGLGSAPGTAGCQGPLGTLRLNQQFPEGKNSTLVITDVDLHCGGDSGGPWMFNLADTAWRRVQYAVHSGALWGGFIGENIFKSYDVAAAVPLALPWIESTMRNRMAPSRRLVITEGVATGYRYRTYSEQPLVALDVAVAGEGKLTTTPATSVCLSSTCAFYFVPGTSVTVTATPDTGFAFGSWTGCPSPSSNTCSLTLTGNTSMAASFSAAECHVDDVCMEACAASCDEIGGTLCNRACIQRCTICE